MTGKVFLNYRRADAEAWADRLFERLVRQFPRENVFMDIDGNIPVGFPWAEWLDRQVAACDLMLVLIGRSWVTEFKTRSAAGERDYVRTEIESALKRKIPVVPVLLGDAPLPRASELPQTMQALLGLQAARLQRSSFDGDAETLAKGIAVSIALARGDARSIPVAPLSPATRSANAPSTALAREKFPPRAVPPSPFSIKVDAKIFNAAPNGQFRPGNGKTEWFKDLDVGPEMVVMPAGEFLMGSNEYHSEKPQHRVTIKKPFAVGRFAITFTEWDAARLPHKPEDMGWGRGQRPVINVSRDDVQGYVNWLSQRTGKPYRLLSESEWEYCCRAGTVTQFAVGDTISKNQAQFSDGQSGSAMQTVEVGTFAPNAWGVYDMHGNVWDMCEDYWHDNYQGAPVDGSVWRAGDTSMCVLRGGAWQGGPDNVRSARRVNCVCGIRNEVIGFRVARTL